MHMTRNEDRELCKTCTYCIECAMEEGAQSFPGYKLVTKIVQITDSGLMVSLYACYMANIYAAKSGISENRNILTNSEQYGPENFVWEIDGIFMRRYSPEAKRIKGYVGKFAGFKFIK